jgi:hypothetical protein
MEEIQEEEERQREMATLRLLQVMEAEEEGSSSAHGGSVAGRRPVKRERREGEIRLYRDYFADEPVYGPKYFRRRYLFPLAHGLLGFTASDSYVEICIISRAGFGCIDLCLCAF